MTKIPPLIAFLPNSAKDRVILALDPGETTGYALMIGSKLIASGQLKTSDMYKSVFEIANLLEKYCKEGKLEVVIEDYRIYTYKTEEHTMIKLHTPKLLGVIESACIRADIPYKLRLAMHAKQFCTDEKLNEWGLWKKGERHARDAIRHATYELIFGEK